MQRFVFLFLTRRSQVEERLTDMSVSKFGLEQFSNFYPGIPLKEADPGGHAV